MTTPKRICEIDHDTWQCVAYLAGVAAGFVVYKTIKNIRSRAIQQRLAAALQGVANGQNEGSEGQQAAEESGPQTGHETAEPAEPAENSGSGGSAGDAVEAAGG